MFLVLVLTCWCRMWVGFGGFGLGLVFSLAFVIAVSWRGRHCGGWVGGWWVWVDGVAFGFGGLWGLLVFLRWLS